MIGLLNNKVAVVTGGCSGIGLGTVELFIAEGAKVVVGDLRDDRGSELEARYGERLCFRRCDVTREQDIAALVGMAETRFGALDILFNNAGAQGFPGNIEVMPADAWDAVMALVLRSTMLGIKHAIPVLKRCGGGSIINTASDSGMPGGMGIPIAPAYAVAKAGVLQLTRVAALEAAPHNIRINTICPGFTATSAFGIGAGLSRTDAEALVPQLTDALAEMQPLRRGGTAEDIAQACLFLASDRSRFMTGTEMVVDGGLLIKPRYDLGPGATGRVMDLLMRRA